MQRNNVNGTSSVHPACAACKHQRKKCSDECVLAPYFPADRAHEFRAVHKVFGVSNVTKIVRSANEEDRQKVADSLVWEAYCRQRDPVLGPYGEYKKLYEEFKLYRSQIQNQNQLVQLPVQGSTMMSPAAAAALIGWNNGSNNGIDQVGGGGGVVNSNGLNYNHLHDDSENSMVDLDTYVYPNFVQSPKGLKQEREVGSVVIPILQQQQHSLNGFNQYYNISGQFS